MSTLNTLDHISLSIFACVLIPAGGFYVHTCGYVYAIGDCAGAIEEKPCPRCGGVLGGLQHKLRPDSYHLPVGQSKPESWMGERAKETLPPQLKSATAATGLLPAGGSSRGAADTNGISSTGRQGAGPAASTPAWRLEIRRLD